MKTMLSHPVVLKGRLVRLEPLESEHIEPLMEIARVHAEEYRLTSTPVTDAQRDAYFHRAFSERDEGVAYPFAIIDPAEGRPIGSSRFADIRWHYRNCELGFTWIDPRYHRTGVNVESKYLMLGYAFETLGFVRVQIHTDVRNTRSQEAIKRLGAVYEGVLRRHMITKDGFVRDTMVFSVTDLDWTRVKAHLEERLSRKLSESRVESPRVPQGR